jgi:hypothetical protein
MIIFTSSQIAKNKGQVSSFVILGVFLVIGSAVSFYMINQKNVAVTDESMDCFISEGDIRYFEILMNICLKTSLKNGLIKIGENGGYIGSLSRTKTKTTLAGKEIAVGIIDIPASLYGMPYSSRFYAKSVKDYPWELFPTTIVDTYTYGKTVLPELMDSLSGSPTIRSELESFIEQDILDCAEVIKNVFVDHDFTYKDSPSVAVALTSASVNAWLDYPIIAESKKEVCKGTKIYDQFYIEIPINFKDFYNFIKDAAEEDTIDIDLDLAGYAGSYPDYDINIDEDDAGPGHDLIEVKNTNAGFIFNNNEYLFKFIRENRIAAIKPLNPVNLGSFCSKTDNLETQYDLANKGIDPDEDTFNFKFEKTSACTYVTLNPDTGIISIDCPDARSPAKDYVCDIKITVDDGLSGSNLDWTTTSFSYGCNACCNTAGCGECSPCTSPCYDSSTPPQPIPQPSCSSYD